MVDPDWRPPKQVADQVTASLQELRQGDIIRPAHFVFLASAKTPLTPEASAESLDRNGLIVTKVELEEAVVVSQTCEVVKPILATDQGLRPFAQVAPLVRLQGQDLSYAKAGRSPRYAAVPGAGEDAFADLERCTTVEKAVLLDTERTRGCPDDGSASAFSRAVARHRGRFAFPGYVEQSLNRMRNRLIAKVGKDSPEGRRVDEVAQIRLVAEPRWVATSVELTVWFLVIQNSLPPIEEDDPVSDEITNWLTQDRPIADLAARLDDPNLAPADRSLLWQSLADAWTELTEPSEEVSAISAVAESLGRYSLAEAIYSEQLDLDHFSGDEA